MKLKFIRSVPVKGDVTSFIFEPREPVSWKPGQYFHYLLPHPGADDRGIERWFTDSAAPFEKNIMISTRINDSRSSSFKHALKSLKPGDEVEADGPKGGFVIDDASRNYIFVAGGIGITPFRSILAEADHNKERLHVRLLYANRDKNIPFANELDRLAANNPDLKIEYIIQPDRIDGALLQNRIAAVSNPMVYVSGPEPMVKSLAELITGLGISEDNLKTDDFPGYESY